MALATATSARIDDNIPDTPEEHKSADATQAHAPIIALVNGLSGGHKGEKVQRLLTQQNIHAFDLLKLSKDEQYFRSFVQELTAIFDNLVTEELQRVKDQTHQACKLHPRILVGGGDGTVAWALSVLDRALLDEQLLGVFWRRCKMLQSYRDAYQADDDPGDAADAASSNLESPPLQTEMATHLDLLAQHMDISDDFYYAHSSNAATSDDFHIMPPHQMLTPLTAPLGRNGITPFNGLTTSLEFDFHGDIIDNDKHPEQSKPPQPCTDDPQQALNKKASMAMMEQHVDDVLQHQEAQPAAAIDADYESSASISAQDEDRIMEEFMSSPILSTIHDQDDNDRDDDSSVAIITDGEQKRDDDAPEREQEGDSEQKQQVEAAEEAISELAAPRTLLKNDSFSESLVTREELHSLRISKVEECRHSISTSYDALRVLQGIYDAPISPAVVLVPLGTGNDLSRCLGTGFAYPGSKELINNLIPNEYTKIEAPITRLDRWRIQFVGIDGSDKERQTSEMLCYFSLGFEGQIAFRFAEARKKNPALFDRPWKNKIQYILSGIGAGVEEALNITKPLNDVIDVFVDGVKLKLPSKTRSLVVSNINSMADGVYFWGNGATTKKDIDVTQYTEPRLGDGKLEVMAAKGIYKYLQMRMGMSHYRRMAQPKKVTIIMKNELPVQVDGESWIETPGIIQIYLFHQVHAVVGKNEPRGVRII
mmetsp:Transcript_37656/g.60302  ORF Transcript_37656/g.60302 Transcript_37656/m.60302 type:complete len:708 (+) Transcript_37656:73-2196(+)